MVAVSFDQQLINLIRSIQEQGILDEAFNQLAEIRHHGNHLFLSQIITSYCHDAQESIDQITTHLNEPVINYSRLAQSTHLLKGCSSSLGACRVVRGCDEIQRACVETDQEKCFRSFQRTKQEFEILQNHLNRISELERSFPSNGSTSRHP